MASIPPKGSDVSSRRRIRCGHCNVLMRRFRLATHTRDSHPGKKPLEKGQSTIAAMFAVASTSTRREDSGSEDKSKSSSSDADQQGSGDESTIHESDREIVSRKETGSEQSDKEDEPLRVRTAIPSTEKRRMTEELDPRGQRGHFKRRRMEEDNDPQRLANLMTNLIQKLEASNISQATPDQETDKERQNLMCLITGCRSRKRLCELAYFTPHDNYIVCQICHSNGHEFVSAVTGVMKYDSQKFGIVFDEHYVMPREFVNLKKSVARHIASKSHCDNEEKNKEDKEQQKKLKAKNVSIGMVLGRAAYKCSKLTRPYIDYETDMLLYSKANMDVGDLNHSEKFPAAMLDAFSKVTDSRLIEFIQTPLKATMERPPVGIIADKVTTRRRTGQLFGAIIFTPGETNLLTAVSLGLDAVKGHTGDALADSIKDACHGYDIEAKQIAGFGFDGQYIKLHVDNHLIRKMGLDEETPMNWDMAHLLQLAESDARPQFVTDVCAAIADVMKGFSYGKMFEELIARAEELDIDLKAPQWFSTTRFATFAHGVFATFVNNYPALRSVLEEVAASTDTKKSHEASDSLGRLNNQRFVIKLILCMDIFKSIGDLSLQLQRVNCEVWTKGSVINEFVESLENFKPKLVTMTKHSVDIDNFEFCGFPLLTGKGSGGLMLPRRQTRLQFRPNEGAEGSSSSTSSSDDDLATVSSRMLIGWTTKMKEEMKKRFTPELVNRINRARDAAALMPLLHAARQCTNQQQFLEHRAVVTLLKAHQGKGESCRNLCTNIYDKRDTLVECRTDFDVYHKVFTEDQFYTGAQHVLQTISREICSAPPEAVVESMGSITELIRKVRGGSKSSTKDTSVFRLSQELKVHWNGPALYIYTF